jgi:hypothetical protein
LRLWDDGWRLGAVVAELHQAALVAASIVYALIAAPSLLVANHCHLLMLAASKGFV